MVDLSSTSLCRICLQDGATLPIFEKLENGENVLSKLSLCIQHGKIEDVEGLPRHICNMCNNTLDTLCDFINKFKESCKILENGLLIVMKEDLICPKHDHLTEVEIDEPIKKKLIKKEPKSRKVKTEIGTNKIASSILEGNFLWNGEKWWVSKIQQKHNQDKLCDVCGDVFKNGDKLSNHKKTVHFKNPIKCPSCPKICTSDYYLHKHMKRKHEKNREFICAACGQGFAFRGDLTSHNRSVHDKVRPKKVYSCKFCDKTYKCAKSTIIHERSVHTGQRPAECSVCNTSFYHEDYLKEHMRLHTGETPFKCPICGRGYAQRGNMKSHLRIHKISELDANTLSKLKPNYLKLLKV
ncbi:hypothetical protein HW555_001554 [Spodoptera exigua]|uniref:C2H2-type domain-containing protein n=1 Tax=Spodoptera exigua TaxID=7107 RepID=A0A835L8V2_SPOEX|nr:hypothetical protein HW555_001554 [Spodoptera exigua]